MSESIRLTLTKALRNKVTERAGALGLEARSFQWSEVPSAGDRHCLVSLLTHRPSGGFFRFDRHAQRGYLDASTDKPFWCEWSPGRTQMTESGSTYNPEHSVSVAMDWLHILKADLETPDLWAELSTSGTILDPGDQPRKGGGGRFTAVERRLATERVEEMRCYLLETAAKSDENRETINRKLDYLIAATERLERFDWRQVAAAVVIQLGCELPAKGPLLPLVAAAWGILFGGHSSPHLIP
jgi:hypothetical protein